jgi:hypothetical protein
MGELGRIGDAPSTGRAAKVLDFVAALCVLSYDREPRSIALTAWSVVRTDRRETRNE